MEDIIRLMKVQKEEQKADLEAMFIRQRNEEKHEREKEKEELVRSIRNGIKEEVKAEMKPLEERTKKIETATVNIAEQVKDLMVKVNNLEEELVEKQKKADEKVEKARYSDVTRNKGEERPRIKATENEREGDRDDVKVIICKAAKIIGLKPIDKLHVEHIKRRLSYTMKDKNEDELWKAALENAVEMFLDKEMRIRGDDLAKINVVKIFPPARDEWNVLYVELDSKREVDFLYTFTQYMRRDVKGDGKPEVQLYVPKQMYKRFMAINLLALRMREDSGRKVGTRVTLGKDDFILQRRSKEDRKKGWGDAVPLPDDLPEIELSLRRGPLSPGEAPGRSPLTPEREDGRRDDWRREGSGREDSGREDSLREGDRREAGSREDGRREGSGRKDSRREESRKRKGRSSSGSPARVTEVQVRDPSQVLQQCDDSTPLHSRKCVRQ